MRSGMTFAMEFEKNSLRETYSLWGEASILYSFRSTNMALSKRENLYLSLHRQIVKTQKNGDQIRKETTVITICHFCNEVVFISQASLSFLGSFYAQGHFSLSDSGLPFCFSGCWHSMLSALWFLYCNVYKIEIGLVKQKLKVLKIFLFKWKG